MAGYSNQSLVSKLGYLPGHTVVLFNAPDWFKKELETNQILPINALPATWLHGFFTTQAQLSEILNHINLNQIEKGLWVSWPKKSSKVPTYITEQNFRDSILPLGWVDTKVCAIDATWSGLKFLRRKNT